MVIDIIMGGGGGGGSKVLLVVVLLANLVLGLKVVTAIELFVVLSCCACRWAANIRSARLPCRSLAVSPSSCFLKAY